MIIKNLLKNKELIISLLIIALLAFLIYASVSFITAIFGAIILSFIFHPINEFFIKKFHFPKKLSAAIVIIIIIIIILVPTYLIINGLINEIKILPEQIKKIENLDEKINSIIPLEIDLDKNKILNQVQNFFAKLATPIFNNLIQLFILVFLMLFLLYYILVYHDEIVDKIYKSLPFKQKNKKIIIDKFYEVTYSAVIGTFLIAIIQGGLIALNFYLLGIPNALFWGFVTVIISILPVLGPPFIWIPATIILFILGDTAKAITLLIVGIMITALDNIIRPIINKKYGSIHPVVSIMGIYLGMSQFGVIGIFLGPLLIVYLLLFWKIYKENYLKNNKE